MSDAIKFGMTTRVGALELGISGTLLPGQAMQKPALEGNSVGKYLSAECSDLLKSWDMTNLIKIRERLMAYLRTAYPGYTFQVVALHWENGSLSLDLG